MFEPTDGICFRCHNDIYKQNPYTQKQQVTIQMTEVRVGTLAVRIVTLAL